MTTEEIAIRQQGEVASLTDVVTQVNLVHSVMRQVMKDGMHYMVIPGCGSKPALLKPGAEKLSLTFKLRPIIGKSDVEVEKLDGNHINVTVYCHILNNNGHELATGIGSASSLESKHRYRGGEKIGTGKPLPTQYWNLKKAGRLSEATALIGGSEYQPGKVDGGWQICKAGAKAENPDIADVWNTVLKMAKKRAYVDGILSATAASDIFTQDIEDMDDTAQTDNAQKTSSKPETRPPQAIVPETIQVKTSIVSVMKEVSKGKTGDNLTRFVLADKAHNVFSTTKEEFLTLAKTAKDAGLMILLTHKNDIAKTIVDIEILEPDLDINSPAGLAGLREASDALTTDA